MDFLLSFWKTVFFLRSQRMNHQYESQIQIITFPTLNRYESNENIVITCSTKVCSFGKQVVEKVETEYSRLESSRFIYRIQRSPMCEYMINFIQKLKGLPERYMMNSVLENFTILQVRFGTQSTWHQIRIQNHTNTSISAFL